MNRNFPCQFPENELSFLDHLLVRQPLSLLELPQRIVNPSVEIHSLKDITENYDIVLFQEVDILLSNLLAMERHEGLVQEQDSVLVLVRLKR